MLLILFYAATLADGDCMYEDYYFVRKCDKNGECDYDLLFVAKIDCIGVPPSNKTVREIIKTAFPQHANKTIRVYNKSSGNYSKIPVSSVSYLATKYKPRRVVLID